MASRGRVAGEYSGTEPATSGPSGEPVAGGSGPIDPADIDGSNGGTSGSGEFDPAIHAGPDKRNADGSYTRKRGRKSGAGNSANHSARKASGNLKGSIDALSKTLVVLHTGIAAMSGIDELAIDKSEGDLLAGAAANVLEHFDIAPDPKVQAIIGFIMAAGTVYGPRVFVYRHRRAQERKEQEPGTAGIYDPAGNAVGTAPFSVVS